MANEIKYKVGFDVNHSDLNKLKSSLQQLQKLSISDIMKINDSDRSSAITALNDIKRQASNVQEALTKAFNVKLGTVNVQAFNQALTGTNSSLQQVYDVFKRGGAAGENAFRSLVTEVTTSNVQLKETHKLLDNIATTLGNTIKWNLASSAVNMMSQSVQQAWGYVKNLDTSLNDIRIVTNKSAEQMANFAVQANQAAQTLGRTTTDYTKAALIYAQQGLSDEEIAERTAVTLKTANVTGQSTAEVSEQLTAVWNGYKVSAEQAEVYIDRLAAVAATTASDLQELSTGMSKVASAAAAMGVGEDQLAAQLSTIISVTRQAPESVGTALRTIYARITDIKAGIDEDGVDLGRYSGKMAALGFNVLDTAGNLRDMGQVIEEIGYKWQDLTREQQVSLAQTMAGQRQYSNLIALFDNFDKYTEALNTAQNAAGTLNEQQSIYLESTAAHLNQLKTATEDLYDSLLNPDSLEPLIDGLAAMASGAAKFVDALGGGGNLLLSLGGIAANVFSNYLTKGVETFVHNLTLSNDQVELMKANIATLTSGINIEGLDENTKSLFEDFRNTQLALAKAATPEEYNQMNEHLKVVTNSLNNYNSVLGSCLEQEDDFQKAQKSINANFGKMQDFALATSSTQQNFFKTLEKASKVYTNISDNIDIFIGQLQDQDQQSKISNKNVENFSNLLKEIKNIDFSSEFGFNLPDNEIDNFIGKLDQLRTQGLDASGFDSFTNEVKQYFQKLAEDAGLSIDEFKQKLQQINQSREENQREIEARRKLLQGIKAQENNRAIGRLIGSVAQLGTSIKITANAFNEFGKGNIGAGLAGLVTSLTTVTTAAINAGTAVKTLSGSLSVGTGVGVALAAVELIVSGLVAWKQAAEEARQAQIDLNNSAIENQQKNQEQIDKKQELLSAVKDLNEEYENGQITRAQLREEIEKLTNQYGVEEGYIEGLIERYGDLAEGIKEARIQQAKRKQESFQTELRANSRNVVSQAANLTGLFANAKINENGKYTYALPSVGGLYDEIEKAGLDYSVKNGRYIIEVDNNAESLTKLYDFLEETRNININDPYDQYRETAQRFLSGMQDVIQKNKQITDELENYLDYDIFSNQYADFDQTKTFEEYKKQRQQLIDSVAQGDSEKAQQVTRAVDKYLKQNYKGLYGQYNETLNYVNELEKRFGNIDQDIIDSIKELDAVHLDELQRRKVDQYEDLRDVLKEVSQLDLSNVQNLTNADPKSLQEVASDRYTFFKSLEDQVKAGKSVSSKQIERFSDYGASQLAQYFTMMANGQSKMTGDAKQFYETILNFELSGFFDIIDALENKTKQLQNFDDYLKQFDNSETGLNDFDYDYLKNNVAVDISTRNKYNSQQHNLINQFRDNNGLTNAELENDLGVKRLEQIKSIDEELAKQQIDLIQIYKEQAKVTQQTINQWKDGLRTGDLTLQQAEDMANAVANIGDKTQTYNEEINSVNQQWKEVQHQIYKVLFPTDADIDETVVAQLSNVLQQLAPESEELSNNLANNAAAAEQIAEAVLRFDDAIQDVVDHYDDWLLALQQQNLSLQDKAVILPQLRDAYADMLDIDGSLLTDDFLLSTQNLEWMKAAIDGDIQAYENLAEAARIATFQMLKIDPSIDMTHFEEDLAYLKNYLNNRQNFPDLEIGAELNDQKFLEELSRMLNTMGVTAAQASDILRQNLGIDTQIIQVKDQAQQKQEYPVTNAVLQQVDATGYVDVPMSTGGGITTRRLPLHQRVFSTRYQPDTQSITTTKQSAGFALKVTSANKSAGGNFKYTHASRGAGAAGVKRRTQAAEKAKKASTPKQVKPDTSTKETKDYAKDDRDIYHDINLEISEINRELERTQKIQDRLFGKQLIANLNKQTDILEKQKVKLKEKIALEKLDLEQQKKQLAAMGAIFDGDRISNYFDLLGNQQGVVNGLVDAYNGLVAQYNASTDKEYKDTLKDQITQADRQLKDAQDRYKEIETAIKNYDSLKDDMEDLTDEITQITQKQIEINIKRFRMSLELTLDMSEARKEWNRFKREVENADNVLKDSDFIKLTKDVRTAIDDYESYFNVKGTNSIQALTESLNDYMKMIDEIDEAGTEAIYGDDKAQAMEHLQNDLNTLMGSMEQIEQLIQSVDQAILDTADDVSDLAQKQIEDYEFVNELYEHDIELLQLLYGDHEYAAMDAYYSKQQENQLKQIDFLKQYRDLAKQQWDEAVARGQSNLAQKWKQQYMQAVRDINSAIVQSVQLLKQKYTNAVNQIFDELERSWTGGRGLQYVDLEWQLLNKNADEYLDNINKAYALQELEQKYLKAIDDNKNVKAQQAITDLMNQQLNSLKAKDKLTQYDVDRAEKLLQIEQARYALAEAQKSKTSLRLKRDSQGNYSYVYAANQEDTAQAEDQLAKLQNELYNFDKQAYKDNLNDILSTVREFREKYQEIILSDRSEEDKMQMLKLLREQYNEYITNKTQENIEIRSNLTESAFIEYAELYQQDYEAFTNMTQAQKNDFMDTLVAGWNDGVQLMTEKFAGEGGFIATCEQAFNDLDTATQNYESELDHLQQVAGADFGALKQGIDETATSFSELITQNDLLIEKMGAEINTINSLKDQLEKLRLKYKQVYDQAMDAVNAANDYLQAQNAIAVAESSKPENKYYQPPHIEQQPQSLPTAPTTVPASTPASSSSGSGTGSDSSSSSSGSGGTSQYWPTDKPSKTIEGIAGSIWLFGQQPFSWNNQPDRENKLIQVFGSSGAKMYDKVQSMFNIDRYGYEYLPSHGIDYDYYMQWTYEEQKKKKKQKATSMDTGGYTGSWGTEGRWALLHQKELVLNANDTKNMLDSVAILRGIVDNLGGNISTRLSSLNSSSNNINNNRSTESLDQNVSIQASFPNVNSKREIEEALNDLVNLAAQRALRRR